MGVFPPMAAFLARWGRISTPAGADVEAAMTLVAAVGFFDMAAKVSRARASRPQTLLASAKKQQSTTIGETVTRHDLLYDNDDDNDGGGDSSGGNGQRTQLLSPSWYRGRRTMSSAVSTEPELTLEIAIGGETAVQLYNNNDGNGGDDNDDGGGYSSGGNGHTCSPPLPTPYSLPASDDGGGCGQKCQRRQRRRRRPQ
jgi:hypothetical protein